MLHFPHNLHWFAPTWARLVGNKNWFPLQQLLISNNKHWESHLTENLIIINTKVLDIKVHSQLPLQCSKHLPTLHCIKFEYPWRDCRPGGEWGWRAFIFILMTVTPIYKNAHCERRRSFLKFFTNENELWYRERGGETNAHGVFAHTHGCALSNICLTQLRKVHGTTTHSPGPGGFLLTQEGDTAVSTNQWTTNKTPDPTMPVIVAL